MKRMMLIGAMAILLGFAASTVSMAQMGSQSWNPNANNQDKKHGLNRANQVNAGKDGPPGQQGRDNAAAKQDAHKPGGSGVTTGPPVCIGC